MGFVRLPVQFGFFLLLAGCMVVPALEFRGIEPVPVEIGTHRYLVFSNGRKAEVIRQGRVPRAEFGVIPAEMEQAVGQVTGCSKLTGKSTNDVAMAVFTLKCD